MPYADQQYLDSYFGSAEVLIAADRDGDGEADVSVVESALDAATELIDSFVGVKYDLPLSKQTITGILKRTCADIAMYLMSVNSPAMTDEKRTRYDDAIKWLKGLARGEVTLGPEETSEAADDEVVLSDSNESRLFSRTKMKDLL